MLLQLFFLFLFHHIIKLKKSLYFSVGTVWSDVKNSLLQKMSEVSVFDKAFLQLTCSRTQYDVMFNNTSMFYAATKVCFIIISASYHVSLVFGATTSGDFRIVYVGLFYVLLHWTVFSTATCWLWSVVSLIQRKDPSSQSWKIKKSAPTLTFFYWPAFVDKVCRTSKRSIQALVILQSYIWNDPLIWSLSHLSVVA